MYHQKQIGLQVPFDFIVVRVYQPHHLQRMQLGRSELSHLVSFFYCHTQLGLFRVFFYCHTCLVFFIFFYCQTWLVIFIVFFIVKPCYFLQLFFYCHTWLFFFLQFFYCHTWLFLIVTPGYFLLSHMVIFYCHTWLFFIVTHGYSILQYFLLSHLDSFFYSFLLSHLIFVCHQKTHSCSKNIPMRSNLHNWDQPPTGQWVHRCCLLQLQKRRGWSRCSRSLINNK